MLEKNIFFCIDMALLLMGILMILLGSPMWCGGSTNDVRATIGAICIALWYVLFPFLDRDAKDKYMTIIVIHLFFLLVTCIMCVCEIKYFLENKCQGSLLGDIKFCLIGVFIFAYLLYVLGAFIKTFFHLVEKVRKFLFPKVSEVKGVINALEGLTAGIISITAFASSIIGFVTLFKHFS